MCFSEPIFYRKQSLGAPDIVSSLRMPGALLPIRARLGLFILEYLVISYLMEPTENNQHNFSASICRENFYRSLYQVGFIHH